MNQKSKIKLCVLHGGISNAGDFIIFERGRKLLETFFGDGFDFTYKLRSKPVNGDFDGIIILGGPLITRKLHPQSKNIIDYIKGKNVPIFCVGLGVSGDILESYENYFLDDKSIWFWRHVYEKSKLFSVRDIISYKILGDYGIKPELTGCPALFNLEELGGGISKNNKKEINKIAITSPNFLLTPHSFKSYLLSLYFLFVLKKKFNKKELGLFFQHGYDNLPNGFIRGLANMFGVKTYNISGKSLGNSQELYEYDAHIGTRLHSHIYFLSQGKPSYLLNVDLRTQGFLKTIKTPSNDFSFSGIKNLVNTLSDNIAEKNFDEFNKIPDEIGKFYVVMKNFLEKINLFFGERVI